jgi:hypothetical protein
MRAVSWASLVKNEVLHRVKEDRNILRAIKRKKDNLIDQFLHGNCLVNHVIEGKIEESIE